VNAKVRCVLADPHGSIFHEYLRSGAVGAPAKFLVEGVGKGSIPGCLDAAVIDDVVCVSDTEAFRTCHTMARREGLLVGGSSGLNAFAALQIANKVTVSVLINRWLQ
jgi:cysteine synthase